ncbi:MAG: hypothetical protein M1480_14565 [Bacteroidetes bacterium]|nr:hypothetical protein [Bacteroidota bacterium]
MPKSESAEMRKVIRAQFRGLMKDVQALFDLSHRIGSWPTGSKVKVTVPVEGRMQEFTIGMKKIKDTFSDWKKQMAKTFEMSLKFKRVSPRMSTTNWYSDQLIQFLTNAFVKPEIKEAESGYKTMVDLFKGAYDSSKFAVLKDNVATHNIITLLFTLYNKTHIAPGSTTVGLKSPAEPRRIRYDTLMEKYFTLPTLLSVTWTDSKGVHHPENVKTDQSDKVANRELSAFNLLQFDNTGKEIVSSNRRGSSVPAFIPRTANNLNDYGFMMASVMKIASFFRVKPEWLTQDAKNAHPIQISPAGKETIKHVKGEVKSTGDQAIKDQYRMVLDTNELSASDRKAYETQFRVWEATNYARELNAIIDPAASKKGKGKKKQDTLEQMMAKERAVTPPKKNQRSAARSPVPTIVSSPRIATNIPAIARSPRLSQ